MERASVSKVMERETKTSKRPSPTDILKNIIGEGHKYYTEKLPFENKRKRSWRNMAPSCLPGGNYSGYLPVELKNGSPFMEYKDFKPSFPYVNFNGQHPYLSGRLNEDSERISHLRNQEALRAGMYESCFDPRVYRDGASPYTPMPFGPGERSVPRGYGYRGLDDRLSRGAASFSPPYPCYGDSYDSGYRYFPYLSQMPFFHGQDSNGSNLDGVDCSGAALKKRRRLCEAENCQKFAQGTTKRCVRHGGGKRCKNKDCKKSAAGSTEYCIAHGGGKRCKTENCPKSAIPPFEFCFAHGGGRRCVFDGCTKGARGITKHCIGHGGGKRCKVKGCAKSDQGLGYCIAHGRNGN